MQQSRAGREQYSSVCEEIVEGGLRRREERAVSMGGEQQEQQEMAG